MSMLAVDISTDETIKKWDEAVLIENQGGTEITMSSLSDFSQRISYEPLARLPQDTTRIITK